MSSHKNWDYFLISYCIHLWYENDHGKSIMIKDSGERKNNKKDENMEKRALRLNGRLKKKKKEKKKFHSVTSWELWVMDQTYCTLILHMHQIPKTEHIWKMSPIVKKETKKFHFLLVFSVQFFIFYFSQAIMCSKNERKCKYWRRKSSWR